jgi:hypothetical protein
MSRAPALLGVALLLLPALASVQGATTRHLELVRGDGRVAFRAVIGREERFDVAFEHSQERVRWIQHYVATAGGEIRQVASTFASYGAGMPLSEPGTRLRRSPQGYVAAVRREFATISMMHSFSARLTLRYRGAELPLDQWFGDYETFVLRVR